MAPTPEVPAVNVTVPRDAATPSANDHPITAIEQASAPEPLLDAEKLVCYDLALELQVLCATLVPAGHRVLKDQLDRASLSVVCNIAEGCGPAFAQGEAPVLHDRSRERHRDRGAGRRAAPEAAGAPWGRARAPAATRCAWSSS